MRVYTNYGQKLYLEGKWGEKPYILTSVVITDEVRGVAISRGIAICSPRDTYDKTRGYVMAAGRALKALRTKRSSGIIHRREFRGRFNTAYKSEYLLPAELMRKYLSSSSKQAILLITL